MATPLTNITNQLALKWYRNMFGMSPRQKPKGLFLPLDFTSAMPRDIDIDIEIVQETARLDFVQSLFVDNSKSGVPFFITCNDAELTLSFLPGQMAFVPFPAPPKAKFKASTGTPPLQAAAIINVHMYNMAVPGVVWMAA